MDTTEYNRLSKHLARTIVAAYGKSPDVWDDLEEQVICAFTFGAHRSFSVASGVQEWESKILMVEILSDVFGFDVEMASNALEYLVDCLDPKFDPAMNQVVHLGDTGSALLDDPKELGRQLREIVYVMGSKLQAEDTDRQGE